ncbi:MAG: hypothetical protein ACE5IZ_00920 [Dehalococcoidia bacterium]
MLNQLLGRWRRDEVSPDWRRPVTVTPVGWVRSSVRKTRLYGWEDVTAEIVVRDELARP